MAAALRFAAREVSRRALQQATAFVSPSPAVKEEQRRLLPRLSRMSLLRPFSSAGAPNYTKPHAKPVADVDLSRVPESIRPQFESWYRRHFAHTRFVNAEPSAPNSCTEPASLRAQIEEKKHELFHLLFELKYGRKSIAGGEKLSIQDEMILGELTPYRELKAMADKYGLKLALKYIGITSLGFAVLGMAVNHM